MQTVCMVFFPVVVLCRFNGFISRLEPTKKMLMNELVNVVKCVFVCIECIIFSSVMKYESAERKLSEHIV